MTYVPNILQSMIRVHPLSLSDLERISELESQIWPKDVQATSEQLRTRIEAFAAGVVGVWVNDSIVGFGTSQIVHYTPSMDEDSLEKLLPRPGVAQSNYDPKGNCLHLMSGGVLPEFRRYGLWTLMVHYRMALARLLHLKYIMVDSRMPSYLNRPEKFAALTADAYSTTLENGLPIDFCLAFFVRVGFRILRPVRSSYPDPESGNVWPFLVRDLGSML